MDDYFTLLLSFGSLTAIIIFLGKVIITIISKTINDKYRSKLNQELEQYKNKLNLETEKYKNDLKLKELEHQAKFNKLNEIRFEKLETLYFVMLGYRSCMFYVCQPSQSFEDIKIKDFTEVSNAKNNLIFHSNNLKIYINASMYDKIYKLIQIGDSIVQSMEALQIKLHHVLDHNERQIPAKLWLESFEKFMSIYNESIDDIVNELRILNGVEK